MPKAKETTTAVVKFDFETAVITQLDEKYKDTQITEGKSYALVMDGLREYRELRLTLVDEHKKRKKDALEFCNSLDTEKRRILALLAPGENHLIKIREVEDARKDAIKAEKEAKERERMNSIQAKINAIFNRQIALHLADLVELRELSGGLEDMEIKEAEYMEFTEEAEKVLEDTYNAAQEAITARIKLDQEAAERKAENVALEEIRKKQEADQDKIDAANKKIKAAQKKIDDEKAKLEADKQAEDDRKEKEAFEKAATEKAEAAAAQKVIDDAKEKKEKERAEEVEKARIEALKPDRQKLINFANDLLEIEIPKLKSAKAIKLLIEAQGRLTELSADVKEQAQEL